MDEAVNAPKKSCIYRVDPRLDRYQVNSRNTFVNQGHRRCRITCIISTYLSHKDALYSGDEWIFDPAGVLEDYTVPLPGIPIALCTFEDCSVRLKSHVVNVL